ncbi:hypothetical protein H0H87_003662 [Tephrocybe sp. NHM501043]|nr:hypothetical protein H0H87_003662 [Tephrocybe sp. NHM501043]
MSYYTVAQLLHENSIDGSKPGPFCITPDQMTDEIWEDFFCDGPFPSPSPLAQEKADALKHEYSYFYPFDVCSSVKDLVPNHVTFCLYNHAAIFPIDKLPLSMHTNGHLMLNGKKMSKSLGNFLTLRDGINKFGADATRPSLADAGDGLEDANFEEKTANANILRVHTLLGWCEDIIKDEASLDSNDVFEHEMNELIKVTQSHYENMNYKDAVKLGFYEFQSARDWYREVTSDVGMHVDLPTSPNTSTPPSSSLTSIQLALGPTSKKAVDPTAPGLYMRETIKTICDAEASPLKMLQKVTGKKRPGEPAAAFDPKLPKSVRIYVATTFLEWEDSCVEAVKEAYNEQTDKVDDAKAFKFGAQMAFRRALPFSESQVLREILPYRKK